jgi:hypothetical protein
MSLPILPPRQGGTGLTSLSALPISTAQQTALDLKADKSQLATPSVQRFSVADGNLTAGQTTISVSAYTPGTVMVFENGNKLPTNTYTATSGTTVVLNDPVQANDVIEVLSWLMSGVQNAAPISHQHSTADLTGPALSQALGGTGATDAAGARANLGAAKSGANTDITSLSGLTTPLSQGQGGLGNATGDASSLIATATGGGPSYTLANWAAYSASIFAGAPSASSKQLQIGDGANTVNYVLVVGGVAGGGPALVAAGSDTNIDINLAAKGTGGVAFGNGSGTLFQVLDSGGFGANWPVLNAAVAGAGIYLKATGTDTNIPAGVLPAGSGALVAQIPDSGVAGGNTRGTYANDWQRSRTNAAHVASGNGSVIVGGANNQANGAYSVTGGQNNNAAAQYSAAFGGFNSVSGTGTFAAGQEYQLSGSYSSAPGGFKGSDFGAYGSQVFASGAFAAAGDAQARLHTLRGSASSGGSARLTTDGGAAGTLNSIPLRNNTTYSIDATVIARDTANTGASVRWTVKGLFARGSTAGSTAAIGTISVTQDFASAALSAAALAVTADTTNGSINFTVTSVSGVALRALARAVTVEVAS